MAAMKTVKVTATGPEGWVVRTMSGKHESIIDQPEAMGGTDAGPSPLEYAFVALGGCIITIAKMAANQKRINLRKVEVEVTGEINLDVLRGKDTDERAGFQSISAKVNIDADLTDEEKKEFLEEVDRRCPISDNFKYSTPVSIEVV